MASDSQGRVSRVIDSGTLCYNNSGNVCQISFQFGKATLQASDVVLMGDKNTVMSECKEMWKEPPSAVTHSAPALC